MSALLYRETEIAQESLFTILVIKKEKNPHKGF